MDYKTKTGNRKKSGKSVGFLYSVWSDIRSSGLFLLTKSSFKSWCTNWPWLILSMLADFAFLIASGVTITLVQFSLFEHLESLMQLAGEATGGLMNIYNQTAEVSSGISGLSQSEIFQYHLNIIFRNLAVMVLVLFIAWIVFQGISWYISYRMSSEKKRMPFLLFWKNFALQSLPFYFLTVFWIFLSVRLLFAIKLSITPFMSEDLLNFLFIVLVLITWYFGSLCYTMTSRYAYSNFTQSFAYGIRRFPRAVQSFLMIAVLFVLLDFILKISWIRSDPFVLMIAGSLTVMPLIVFARILLFKTSQMYWQGKEEKKRQVL